MVHSGLDVLCPFRHRSRTPCGEYGRWRRSSSVTGRSTASRPRSCTAHPSATSWLLSASDDTRRSVRPVRCWPHSEGSNTARLRHVVYRLARRGQAGSPVRQAAMRQDRIDEDARISNETQQIVNKALRARAAQPARLSTRDTCIGFQGLPRRVVCPWSFKSSAMACSDCPFARSSVTTGYRSA